MTLSSQILIAFVLDLAVGDPRHFPHPVRWIGRFAIWCEKATREIIANERIAGCVTVLMVLGTTGGLTWGCLTLADNAPWARDVLTIWLLFTALATHDLARHAIRVKRPLEQDDLPTARNAVSMIVGRDTDTMDAPAVARATVESIGENMVDGVTAPLMVMLVFGPIGVMVYKAASTLDSLFGYRNERYLRFGTCAARLDDVFTALPARLTLPCATIAAFLLRLNAGAVVRITLRDRNNHDSPNSAWGEAAIAGALGAQLGGAAEYRGNVVIRPTIGDGDPVSQPKQIAQAVCMMVATSIVCLALGMALREIV
jgi:adenosylcobinamide-phosphate synthase